MRSNLLVFMLMSISLASMFNDGLDTTYAWYGTAPFCFPEDCPDGWTFVKNDDKGDGSTCWIGEKTLCKFVDAHNDE
ncbi:hypothetical protein PRIPAC_77279 [Pristionchus pacificus]|uniref:Uncharacterized protein n=1 Tax=Pristionchus pacificus TaxID=54126 RepID=A0A2A6BVN9_PRIPA|nr:hypothetical protein PRIPAC_77279 [Pristionchus pacificus]|eukprot:PDM69974.1 hypothetical protein PRIPAC_49186 [Pristionchus pacificus]